MKKLFIAYHRRQAIRHLALLHYFDSIADKAKADYHHVWWVYHSRRCEILYRKSL